MELWSAALYGEVDFDKVDPSVSVALATIQHELRREYRERYATDPLSELTAALQRGEQPTLAWVVQWSEQGRLAGLDPLAAAWMHSGDTRAMVWILRRTDREYLAKRVEAAAHTKIRGAVARAVPLAGLPTLTELF